MTSYRDPYGRPSFWEALNRALGAWFRLGVFFGVEVRVLWLAVVLFPLFTLSTYPAPVGEVLIAAVVYPASLLLIIYSHEMMHVAAGWRYNIRTPLITLSPLGGLAHMNAAAPNPRGEMFIALAGPAVHLVWLAIFWPLSLLFDGSTWVPGDRLMPFLWTYVDFLVYVNVVLMVFNLLPFYPMDGGRVLRALLAQRMHANRATVLAAKVGMFGAVALGIYGFYSMFSAEGIFAGVLLAIALRSYFDCQMTIRAAQFSSGPYGEMREPWETDGNWWKQGAEPTVATRRPGPLARFLGRRRQRQAQRQAEVIKQLDKDIDGILERVSKVGLTGLSDQERKTLERASKLRRKTGG